MKNLTHLILSLAFIISITACQKDDLISDRLLSNKISTRNSTLDDISNANVWFENFLVNAHGQTKADSLLDMFNLQWSNTMNWNDSTIVVPCNQFICLNAFGYTRLFIQLKENSNPEIQNPKSQI